MPPKLHVKHHGLRHLALNVQDIETAVSFYERVFGMRMAWQPDEDNAYLTSGCDNLALHRALRGERSGQALDHFGFIVPTLDELQTGYDWALKNRINIERPLRHHRDGSVSYYIRDPDGNLIQILYEPSISPIAFQDKPGPTD